MSPLESAAIYALPYFLVNCPAIAPLFWKNMWTQLAIFVPIVQIPALLKSRMSYVDLGWPYGLCALALNTIFRGEGDWKRRALCGSCLLLHGFRMSFGATMMFYPYNFKEDLPRYQYAKVRFETQDGMPSKYWPIKIQHDTLQQAFANSVVLAAPFLCLAQNTSKRLHALEVLGALGWAISFHFENKADLQKDAFVRLCKKNKADPASRTAVLGHAPYDTKQFSLWTKSRHPNYFCEWMCWNSFMVMGIPSLMALEDKRQIKLGLALSYYMLSRLFFDCLCYWTGGEPAEHFSVAKRPNFKEYQTKTRMFFPFEVPFFNHHRIAGWPDRTD